MHFSYYSQDEELNIFIKLILKCLEENFLKKKNEKYAIKWLIFAGRHFPILPQFPKDLKGLTKFLNEKYFVLNPKSSDSVKREYFRIRKIILDCVKKKGKYDDKVLNWLWSEFTKICA